MKAIKYKVVNSQGKEVGEIELNAEVFGAEINASMVHDAVRWQRAKARAGTHSSLTKGMMKGGNRKPWKQKGTGRARSGSNTSPLWVGGAKAHGPQPRDYEYRLSKRAKRQALVSVLSEKVVNKTLIVVDELSISKGKTKEVVAILKNLGVDSKKLTVVLPTPDAKVWQGAGNLKNVIALPVTGVNVYDLLRHPVLVATKEGVKALETRLVAKEA